jgi:hypothetical protein
LEKIILDLADRAHAATMDAAADDGDVEANASKAQAFRSIVELDFQGQRGNAN